MESLATLQQKYQSEVRSQLEKNLGLENVHRVPRLEKIVVNMGLGILDENAAKAHVAELASITGQKPAMTRARRSISNFKLRAGDTIGARVTLRRRMMYEFLERLIVAALPRIRDFRGVSRTSFDGHGNYTLGIKDQTIFPEIEPDDVNDTQGMDITFVTSTENDDEARELLKLLGVPFAEK